MLTYSCSVLLYRQVLSNGVLMMSLWAASTTELGKCIHILSHRSSKQIHGPDRLHRDSKKQGSHRDAEKTGRSLRDTT